MKHAIVITTAALLTIVICLVAHPQPTVPESSVGFTGKVIFVYNQAGGAYYPNVISDYRFQSMHDKLFLVGTSVHISDTQWQRGKTIWISWDTITTIIEFESAEEYKDRIKQIQPPKATENKAKAAF